MSEDKLNLKKRTLTRSIDVPIVEETVISETNEALDKFGRAYATGRRKQAIARLWLTVGDSFVVNGMKLEEYFPQEALKAIIKEALVLSNIQKAKIFSTVTGGGKVAQAYALRLALSKALVIFEPNSRVLFKSRGYLTTDSRRKEREHCGFRTSRKPQQYCRR